MSSNREQREIDPRLHAFLDGELPGSESAAFEGELRSGSVLGDQLRTLQHLGAWAQATRPRAPSLLFRDVARALEAEPADPTTVYLPSITRWWKNLQARSLLRWAWIPAAAAVTAVVVLTSIGERKEAPSDGIPQPSESVVAAPENGSQPGENEVRYVFTLQAGDAKEVCLAGDFNRWRVCAAPLERVSEDTWTISVDLPPGRHQYMFVIDGRWVTDPNAVAYDNDGFGNRNAVVII